MDILIDILNLGESKTWIVYLVACLLSFMPFAILGFLFSKHRQEEPYLLSLDRIKGLKTHGLYYFINSSSYFYL